MERTIYHYVDGVAIPIPSCTGFGPTPFLKKMVRLFEDNKVTMDELAKTPITKEDLDDIFADATVTPL